MSQLNQLNTLIATLIQADFWGTLTLHIQAGEITIIGVNRTYKLPQPKPPKVKGIWSKQGVNDGKED
jgi:hypothetical protein